MVAGLPPLPKGTKLVTAAEPRNPFDIVKATDLTDVQIEDYWVDLPNGSLLARVKPTSAMPMFILGGKGSGKTHLMRYLSYPLQKLRFAGKTTVHDGIREEGYLGTYVLAGGLNGSRFFGKGQDAQRWQDVFAYYFELWLARILLDVVQDILRSQEGIATAEHETQVAAAVIDLFDREPFQATTIRELLEGLKVLQKRADLAINNASTTRQLEVEILATRGSLFFGVPRALCDYLPFLAGVRILYLIDELENFTRDQQAYINTLVRERRDPVGIKVGARLYGIRTYETLGSGEENRPESEFEPLKLDLEFRERPSNEYRGFVEQLFIKRLRATGYLAKGEVPGATIDDFFENPSEGELRENERAFFAKKYGERERPYMVTLRRKLRAGLKQGVAPGVASADDIDRVLATLAVETDPFCEKLNTFLLYRAWAAKRDLVKEAQDIGTNAEAFLAGEVDTLQGKALEHWRSDVWAQLRRDTGRPQAYFGFETFVAMSAGLPRCVLTTLKHIFSWALFYGEQPFGRKPISTRAQRDGVAAAAEWFYSDARAPGEDGAAIRLGMTQLGELLRDLRYSDKPAECALSTFSVDLAEVTAEVNRILKAAEFWSMLINVPNGQHEKNTGRVDPKFRVHPMLASRWDLPFVSRGTIGLSSAEANAIFDRAEHASFKDVRDTRVARTTAPLFGRAVTVVNQKQTTIPGLDDD